MNASGDSKMDSITKYTELSQSQNSHAPGIYEVEDCMIVKLRDRSAFKIPLEEYIGDGGCNFFSNHELYVMHEAHIGNLRIHRVFPKEDILFVGNPLNPYSLFARECFGLATVVPQSIQPVAIAAKVNDPFNNELPNVFREDSQLLADLQLLVRRQQQNAKTVLEIFGEACTSDSEHYKTYESQVESFRRTDKHLEATLAELKSRSLDKLRKQIKEMELKRERENNMLDVSEPCILVSRAWLFEQLSALAKSNKSQ
jgi:hypothetical protein